MKISLVLVGTAMLSSLVAFAADEAPKYETFLGYDFVRFETNSGVVPSFNANGGSGQFTYNFNKWVGAVMDLGAVTKGTLGGYSIDTTVLNFVAGPRFAWHNESRLTPFVQTLFGGAYGTTSAEISVPFSPVATPAFPIAISSTTPISARLVASSTHFAMLAGGGLDLKVSKHLSFRPFEVDYYLTRMPDFNTGNHTNQHNLRYSAGVNFLFGAQ